MRTGDLSELTGTMMATQPVRAGRLRRTPRPGRINPSCIDPVAARLIQLYPLPNVPGAGFFNNNFISNGVLNNDINQFDVRVDHNLGAGATTCSCATATSRPTASEPPVLERPGGLGRLRQQLPDPRPERRRRLVAGVRRSRVQRVPRRLQPRPLRRGAPVVRHRLERRSTASRACPTTRASTAACRTCRSRASRGSAGRSSGRSSRPRRCSSSPRTSPGPRARTR